MHRQDCGALKSSVLSGLLLLQPGLPNHKWQRILHALLDTSHSRPLLIRLLVMWP